jgi:hypothetical protein
LGANKYLFPWEETVIFQVGKAYCRRSLAGKCQCTIWQEGKYWYFGISSAATPLHAYWGVEAAMGACDRILIEGGYYLIGKDEMEKWEGRKLLV